MSARLASAPNRPARPFAFNPYAAGFSDDPYPHFDAVRRQGPVIAMAGCLGTDWVITGYEEALTTLRHPHCGPDDLSSRIRALAHRSGAPESVEPLCTLLEHWFFLAEHGLHKRLRAVLEQHFRRATILRHTQSIVDDVDALLVQAETRYGQQPMDLVQALARPLPLLTTARLLGLHIEDIDFYARVASGLFSALNQPQSLRQYQQLNEQATQFADAVTPLISNQSGDPDEHLGAALSRLVHTAVLTMDEAVALVVMLFSVGQDTVQHLIANAVLALMHHPSQWQQLRAAREVSGPMVRELARFDTSVPLVVRVAESEFALGTQTIAPGDRLNIFIGAANRDPRAFREPDCLDLTRETTSRISFGAGGHHCLGVHLAQSQIARALQALATKYPHMRLHSAPQRLPALHVRGLAQLLVRTH